MARMALSKVGRQRMVVGPMITTTTPESRSDQPQETVGQRKSLNCCQDHLNPDSICSLAHFSVLFSFWQFRVQTVATATNATVCVQITTPQGTHTRALFLAARATCDYTFGSRPDDSLCLEKSFHLWSCFY